MTLEEYVGEMEKTLKDFKRYWAQEAVKDPEIFPPKMSAGDWDEQFWAFSEGVDD